MNADIVADYADAMRSGATFPPITVFHDGQTHWLADGFHRVAAAEQAGIITIAADIRQGGI
ncbi:MAG: streptomycin biosynthesis regulator, partial [Thermomicrobiales bacterium]